LPSDAEPGARESARTGRLEAFSDGVFAIAITLLVLELSIESSGTALERVLAAWRLYLAYIVSFLTIGAAWLAHTGITKRLVKVDAILLRLNLLLLLLISFLPFPTRLRVERGKLLGAVNMLVDISERKEAEANQRILFNELNHRVKNNMQLIQSLLDRAARQVGTVEPQEIFRDLSRRIQMMLAAQRMLYATNKPAHIGAREFVAEVCNAAQQALAPNVSIDCDADDFELSNDMGMPLALIFNELLTNAAKHGAHTESPVIRVRLIEDGDDFVLSVEDDGAGFDLQDVGSHASGLALVQGLARQLRGSLLVSREPTRCSVRFQRTL
jgi:two-component sensor histidine kinase